MCRPSRPTIHTAPRGHFGPRASCLRGAQGGCSQLRHSLWASPGGHSSDCSFLTPTHNSQPFLSYSAKDVVWDLFSVGSLKTYTLKKKRKATHLLGQGCMSAEPAGRQPLTTDTLERSFRLQIWGQRWYSHLALSLDGSVTPLNGRTRTWTQDLKSQVPSLFSTLPVSGGDSSPSLKEGHQSGDLSDRKVTAPPGGLHHSDTRM